MELSVALYGLAISVLFTYSTWAFVDVGLYVATNIYLFYFKEVCCGSFGLILMQFGGKWLEMFYLSVGWLGIMAHQPS